MVTNELVLRARTAAGLSQADLASLSGTSRPTLSSYERGQKSPTLTTASRIIEAAGFELTIQPKLRFAPAATARGRVVFVPNQLPRLDTHDAFATVMLPLHLNWSTPARLFDLSDRRQRARVYEIVLREGAPDDIARYVDGTLLIDLWNDLVLPRDVRAAWAPVVSRSTR